MKAKKLLAGILSAAMVFSSMALPAFASEENAYPGYTMYNLTTESSTLTISNEKAVLKGIANSAVTVTLTDDVRELVLDNASNIVSITGAQWSNNWSEFAFVKDENGEETDDLDESYKGIQLKLVGNNKVTNYIKAADKITITGGDNDYLTVGSTDWSLDNMGIDAYDVEIDSGNVTACGNDESPAIGGTYMAYVHINGGTVNATACSDAAAIGAGNGCGGYVKITGGTVNATNTSNGAAIGSSYKRGDKVWITGGIVNAKSTRGSAIGNKESASGDGKVVIEGGTINAESTSGALIGTRKSESWETARLYGGSYNFDLAPYAEYVMPGYFVVEADGRYDIVPAEAQVGDAFYATLADAFAAAKDGETVTLLDNVTLKDNIYLTGKGNITLDLETNILTHDGDNGPSDGMIVLENGTNLEIENGSVEVKLVKEKNEYVSGSQSSVAVGEDSSLTVKDINLTGISANAIFDAHDGGSIVIDGGKYTVTAGGVVVFAYGDGTNVEINGGTFTGTDMSEGAVYAFNNANVTVNGGNFNFSNDKEDYSWAGFNGEEVNWLFCDYSGLIDYPFSWMDISVTSGANISVKGGTYNKDISSLGNFGWYTEDGEKKFASRKINYLAKGKMLKDNGDGTYTVEDIEEKLENKNATAEEKVDTINNAVISTDNTEVTEKVVATIKNLPVEKKEEIAPAKVEEIIAATSEAAVNTATNATESDDGDTIAVTATLTSIDSSLTLDVKPKTEDSKIELPAGTKAARFEVTVTKTTGTNTENVAETDVPMLLTFKVTNVNNVKSVIRYHGGKQETVPFTRDVENNLIMVTAAKFSEYVVAEATTPTTGGAVLTFEENGDENDGICNIYLKGETAEAVTKFESGEFTITDTASSGKVGIELEGAKADDGNALLTIDEVNGVYEIHRTTDAADASTYPEVLTGNKILLGTITLNGTGKGQIYAGNIKMHKKGNTDSQVVEIPTLSDTLEYDIKAETATLTVKVAFPNAVENQKTAYQDMKITISGGDLAAEDIVYNLGSDASENVAWDAENAVYTLAVADELTKNVAYTVKVEGAGYRTARYTVNMTEDKTLNFWNNVKDTEAHVEESVGTAKKTTFLAGDIVKDNQINIYDLSAVVSYFGTDNLVEAHLDYAKYDLNRDGKIDSKDIAYVLVSWGK